MYDTIDEADARFEAARRRGEAFAVRLLGRDAGFDAEPCDCGCHLAGMLPASESVGDAGELWCCAERQPGGLHEWEHLMELALSLDGDPMHTEDASNGDAA